MALHPKHGSWLDLAESELGVLSSQCLDRQTNPRRGNRRLGARPQPPRVVCGDFFFVHAGVRPGTCLTKQSEDDDLLWIREDFLLSEDHFGKVVVHGHTPVLEPDVRPNRINIDTGAQAAISSMRVALSGMRRSRHWDVRTRVRIQPDRVSCRVLECSAIRSARPGAWLRPLERLRRVKPCYGC